MTDDEREAREWLGRAAIGFYETDKRHRATILALLDAAEAGVTARDAALEECKAALRTAYVEDEAGTLGMFDAIEIVDALRRTA